MAGVITLEIPQDAHAASWFALFDDPAVMRFIGDGAVHDLDWYRDFVRRQQRYAQQSGLCLFSAVAGGQVVGFVGVQPWTQPWGPVGESELGWRLGRAHWGHGYAAKAGRLALALARERGVTRVVSLIQSGNNRSVTTAAQLGMNHERDWTTPAGGPVLQYARTTGP